MKLFLRTSATVTDAFDGDGPFEEHQRHERRQQHAAARDSRIARKPSSNSNREKRKNGEREREGLGHRGPLRRGTIVSSGRWVVCPPMSCNVPKAAVAADSVVMVGIRAVTAARRIAFSSNHGSTPCGVLMIN